MRPIKLGTRKSKLALWQAEHIADLLQRKGYRTELMLQETKGDQVLDVAISKIGSKGVFTEELEESLASGQVDVAVHSAKDMQSRLPDGFEIIAFTEREKSNDVVVSDGDIDLSNPDLVLGTSSTRRVATFKHFYPHITTVDVRGNLQTRIEKMRSGLCDGLVLAYAGVHRMGYDQLIKAELSFEEFIPAVGQGSIAIEANVTLDPQIREIIRKAVNHDETERCLLAERAFLAHLDGGCSIPVFAKAHEQNNTILLEGGIVSLDGKERIVYRHEGSDPSSLGTTVAEEILERGGAPILHEIKRRQNLH